MKKFLSCILALLMCVNMFVPAFAEEAASDSETLTDRIAITQIETFDVTTFTAVYGELISLDIPLTFINGDYAVPYMSLEDYFDIINELAEEPGCEYLVEYFDTEDGFYCTRENGSGMLLDFEDGTILISNPDMFEAAVGAVNGSDIMGDFAAGLFDENGEKIYDENENPGAYLFYRVDDGSTFTRDGSQLMFALIDSNFTMFVTDEGHFLPVAALTTFFDAGAGYQLVFNGKYLFILANYRIDDTCVDENGKTLMDYYYDVPSTERPESLAALNYELLCAELDLHYGLKEAHAIGDSFDNSFDEYLDTIGLKDYMLDPDGTCFYDAMSALTRSYFADFHSAVISPGCYAGRDYEPAPADTPASSQYVYDAEEKFNLARLKAGLSELTDEGGVVICEPYMEVGNTAYITFDAFAADLSVNYYDPKVQENLESYISSDTIALTIYAAQQINRENSPIEHVVVDLSCNGGGQLVAAAYITAWLIGSFNVSTMNPTTNAMYNVTYKADTNLDGVISDEDALDLDRFDVYCLTSLNSFSCGNLVPYALKDSGKVTLLGQTSGGGACVVRTGITADGTVYQFSGSSRMCTVKNGSFYSVDEGVDPDFVIRKTEHFYDREWLNSFIENLP